MNPGEVESDAENDMGDVPELAKCSEELSGEREVKLHKEDFRRISIEWFCYVDMGCKSTHSKVSPQLMPPGLALLQDMFVG